MCYMHFPKILGYKITLILLTFYLDNGNLHGYWRDVREAEGARLEIV